MIRNSPLWQFDLGPMGNPSIDDISITEEFFAADECDAVLDVSADMRWHAAQVSSGPKRQATYEPSVRSARSARLPIPGTWPYKRLYHRITAVNDIHFRFRLHGVPASDCPSVIRYESSTTDHFRPHRDSGPAHSTRRLSYVVQLTEANEYIGGDLVFRDVGLKAPRDRGTLVIFPSSLLHVVTPVVAGVRETLVGWIHGPAPV